MCKNIARIAIIGKFMCVPVLHDTMSVRRIRSPYSLPMNVEIKKLISSKKCTMKTRYGQKLKIVNVKMPNVTHIIGPPGKRGPYSFPLPLISNPFAYHFNIF